MTETSVDHELDGGSVTDDELCALALAADPDAPIADDAVPFGELIGTDADGPLPAWYMPPPVGGRLVSGWRRIPPLMVIGSLMVINASGLCITYGKLGW